MGIDVNQLKQKDHREEPEVKEWIQLLSQRYAGTEIVIGRDKLDEVQGVRHKIKAFEYFLQKHPEYQGKAILIQIALPAQSPHAHTLTHPLPKSSDVMEDISHINPHPSTLTYQPIVFLHTQDLTFSQYLALLSAADAFIVTSLRERMALHSHEFVECQEGKWRPLVLSEFTGSYSYSCFRSCIAINPWDMLGTAEAINQALTRSNKEAHTRWEDLHNHVTTQTAQAFITFLTRTLRAHAKDLSPHTEVPNLNITQAVPQYKHSRGRLVLIDLEGTVWKQDLSREGLAMMEEDYLMAGNKSAAGEVKMEGEEDPCAPRVEVLEEVVRVLEKLVADPRNEVWLLSGLRVSRVLDRGWGFAKNWCFIKTIKSLPPTRGPGSLSRSFSGSSTSPPRSTPRSPAKKSRDGEWMNMVVNFNLSWKTAYLEILSYFTECTPGAFIEERDALIVYRFWTGGTQPDGSESTDRQWARRQAAEEQNHVFDSLGERYGLRIIPSRNSFLVLPNNVSCSTAVGTILHPGGPTRSPLSRVWMSPNIFDAEGPGGLGSEGRDLILAVSGDKKVLSRLNEYEGAETCSTSGRGIDARWRVEPGGHWVC